MFASMPPQGGAPAQQAPQQGMSPMQAQMARYQRGGGGMPPQGAMPPGGPQMAGGAPMPSGGPAGMAGPQPGNQMQGRMPPPWQQQPPQGGVPAAPAGQPGGQPGGQRPMYQ